MKKIMIVDDNYLSAEGIEKNIDWEVPMTSSNTHGAPCFWVHWITLRNHWITLI